MRIEFILKQYYPSKVRTKGESVYG